MPSLAAQRSVLPGFGLTLGITLSYLSLLVLIPLSALVIKTFDLDWATFWKAVTSPQVVASYKLSFGASFFAALVNVVFGLLVAWVLVRYRFPGRRVVDALVDLPFALPTAVAGIALCALYAPNGWIGSQFTHDGVIGQFFPGTGWAATHLYTPASAEGGLKLAYTPLGVTIALIFIGLPFVVRTVQPVLEDLGKEVEEAASSLGANRWQIFTRIIFPELAPALLTGFALAFARAVGEYGSVVFISGNLPMKTEITPLLIITKLEQYKYAEATAIATVMLAASFVLLLLVNLLQRWTTRRAEL
ncbi:MAG TPA: sulfate ABC transporter permease subunit CysT [Planctomycetota bacterium]|jgi:sulfate transport system permease protein|nr:sulfate ABC transporter permease subunit CysT [Planctomycetota bacterium]